MIRALFFALISTPLSLFVGAAHASTFVGNGGNAGDVEWLVTLKQISVGYETIATNNPDDETLCTCSGSYTNSSICDALNSLTKPQRLYCGATLKQLLPQLRPLVRDPNTVHVTWTTDSIDVLEDGRRRNVDAVTDRTRGTVTMNNERFREMNPSERVFLIAHELTHLTSLNGAPVVDEGAIGPFMKERDLVNAMAAAVVIQADNGDAFKRYSSALSRPQGWRENWIEYRVYGAHLQPQSIYAVDDYNMQSIRFTHFFSAIGVNLEYIDMHGARTVLGSVNETEKAHSVNAGLSYRWFPFKDPLTAFGQSHFVLNADVDFVHGDYSLSDGYNNESASSSRVGFSGGLRYDFPLVWGLWIGLAETYESQAGPYTLSGPGFNLEIPSQTNFFATSIGVSYAF